MIPVDTVLIPCPSCRSSKPQLFVQGYDRLLGHPGVFTICVCKQCGLIYLNPRPHDLMLYYEGEYLPYLQHKPYGVLERIRRIFPKRLTSRARVLSKISGNPGRVLDIGCAGGDFLGEMADAGWDVAGVEPSTKAAAVAEERFPGCIVHGTLENTRYPDGHFDLVTMWDVVEHLPNPLATLHEVRRILRPGGILFIQTPRWGNIDSRLFGPAWAGWECPRHLCIFTGTSLGRILEQVGLVPEELPQLVSSHWVWALSILFWVQERYGPHAGNQVYHLLIKRSVRLLLLPFFKVLDHSGLGSLLTVVGRKEH